MSHTCHNRPHSPCDREPCRCQEITAPYCPRPGCPPLPPAEPMDDCGCRGANQASHTVSGPLHKAAPWPRPVIPCPPPHYSGVICAPQPVRPQKPRCDSVLLQKILGCERRSIPQLCTRLTLELPECACPPFRLTEVHQSGAQPWWTPVESHGPDARRSICVSIPVCCTVCDGEGRTYHANAVAEAQVSYCPPGDSWRSSVLIIPWVRMCGGEVCADEPCFCAQLEMHLEIYLLRPEPCAMHRPEPPCPDKPLYPEPPCRDWHPRF